MASSKRLPYITMPLARRDCTVAQRKISILWKLYLDIQLLVLETLLDVVYSIDCKDGVMGCTYGYNRWGWLSLLPIQDLS